MAQISDQLNRHADGTVYQSDSKDVRRNGELRVQKKKEKILSIRQRWIHVRDASIGEEELGSWALQVRFDNVLGRPGPVK